MVSKLTPDSTTATLPTTATTLTSASTGAPLPADLGRLIREEILEKKSPSLLGRWQPRTFRLYETCILYSSTKVWAPDSKQNILLNEIRTIHSSGNVLTISKEGTDRKPYQLRGDAASIQTWVQELSTLLGSSVVVHEAGSPMKKSAKISRATEKSDEEKAGTRMASGPSSSSSNFKFQPPTRESQLQSDGKLKDSASSTSGISVASLNFQYYSSYPKDKEAATAKLRDILGSENPPDFICVQEGLATWDVLDPIGYKLSVCSAKAKLAQTVKDMVYSSPDVVNVCPEALRDDLLCNQIYTRKGSEWDVIDSGAIKVSSDLQLDGGGGRVTGPLAIRSAVWVKACRKGTDGPRVFLFNTHISGGRFEDQFFVQQLAEERYNQPDRVVKFFESRSEPRVDDVGILAGDFNATTTYETNGPMSKYFQTAIANSPGVQLDVAESRLQFTKTDLEGLFKTYMLSPFRAIQDRHKWTLAYNQEIVGATSMFGHLIDHMAVSRPMKIVSVQKYFTTNQRFSKTQDTDLPLTDHNCVKIVIKVDPN